jgi:hypothetical protein
MTAGPAVSGIVAKTWREKAWHLPPGLPGRAGYSAFPSRIGPNSSHFSPVNFIICTCSIG